MRWKGIDVWQRDSGGGLNLISFHSRHSLTWSWFINFRRFRADEARVRPLWWGIKHNCGYQRGIRLPHWGHLTLHRQWPMYYRDLVNSERDRLSQEMRFEYERGRSQGRLDVFQGAGRSDN